MKKRILSIVLALCLVFSLLPVTALADTTASGTCGDNLTWTLDSNGTLTISGTGEMDGYYSSQNSDGAWVTTAPWGMYYKSIKNVVIEEGVTSIGYQSLYGCRCLTSITIPSSVTNIGGFAFCDCSSLISVKIPNSVTSIGAGVFEGCSSLMSVTIPDSATSIGDSMFSGCCNLASVIIPDSVSKIGGSAFSGCSSLVSVTIPKSVTIIGGSAFYGCYRLKSVTILGNLTSIGDYAFYGCALLEDIYYSSSAIGWVATEIGTYNDSLNNAELHCPEGSFFCYGKCGNTLFWGLDRDGTLTISGTGAMDNCSASKNTDGDYVTTAPWREHYKSIKSVVIENGVTSVGEYAFRGCSSLTNVTIPDSLTAVGWVAFGNCSSITDVYYTGDLSSWLGISFSASSNPCHNGANLYFNGELVTDVVIPNSVTSIGDYAFSGCSGLTSVIIPDNVTSIGYSAFSGCSSLTSITIPDGVTSIGDSAFYGCDKIKDVAFAGTKEAWNAIGYTFSGIRMHYNCASLEGHYVLMEILEPTCKSAGYKKYSCVCGNEYKETLPINHDYEFSKAVASTCISYGYDLFVCSKCGAEKKDYYNELSDHNYQITAVEPSCLTGGYTLHKCSGCGDSYKDELLPALGHSEVSTGAKAPTCIEAGHTAGTCCSRCGKVMSGMEEIAALSHNFGEWTQTKAPTCTENGTESRTCTRCNATETRVVDALGHDRVHHEGKVPTCTEIGWESYDTCTRCDYTTYEEIAATGHHYTDTVTAPTCTERGYTTHTCNCGDSYVDSYVDALGHNLIHHEGKAATCTEKGWEAYDTCTRCDYTTYEEIAANGHHYTDTVTAPTCTEKGYTTHTCDCGDSYIDSYVDATGHNFGAWTQTKAPTCTASGTEIRSCANCGETETREIAALDHNLVHHDGKAPTCTEKGWEAYDTCSRCDYTTYKEIAALGHNNIHHDGKTPTCTEKGWEAYDTCSRCDYSTYKEIAATGHHYADTVTAPTCTAKGYTTHTCACGNSYVDNYTNALGHSYKNGICTRCNAKDPSYVAAPVIKITTSAGKPKISWSKVDGATKYYVYRSTDGKKYSLLVTTEKTSVTNSNAKIGTTYYYKVKAAKVVNDKTVKSAYSNVKSIKCTPAAPVVSISRSSGKPKLTWKAVTGASKYYIYRSTDGKTYKQYTTTTKTTYTNTGAASGKKYYYKVKAVAVVNKKNVFSAYSSAKNLMTTLAAPTVSITTVNGKPKVSWKAVTGADKYIVYRSTDGKTFKQLSTTTKTSLTNTGAKKNTKYYYKVKAVCTKNTSANSALSKAVSIKATK